MMVIIFTAAKIFVLPEVSHFKSARALALRMNRILAPGNRLFSTVISGVGGILQRPARCHARKTGRACLLSELAAAGILPYQY